MWYGRFLSGVVITSEARNLLLLALERPLRKQQIPHGLNFTPGSAVRDDNSKSRSRTLLMQHSMTADRLKQQHCSNHRQADVNVLEKGVTMEAAIYRSPEQIGRAHV